VGEQRSTAATAIVVTIPQPPFSSNATGDAALARLGRQRKIAMTLPVFSGVCAAVYRGRIPLIAFARALQVMCPARSAGNLSCSRALRCFTSAGSIAAIVWLTVAASVLVVQ
jgi:hypothetical protein